MNSIFLTGSIATFTLRRRLGSPGSLLKQISSDWPAWSETDGTRGRNDVRSAGNVNVWTQGAARARLWPIGIHRALRFCRGEEPERLTRSFKPDVSVGEGGRRAAEMIVASFCPPRPRWSGAPRRTPAPRAPVVSMATAGFGFSANTDPHGGQRSHALRASWRDFRARVATVDNDVAAVTTRSPSCRTRSSRGHVARQHSDGEGAVPGVGCLLFDAPGSFVTAYGEDGGAAAADPSRTGTCSRGRRIIMATTPPGNEEAAMEQIGSSTRARGSTAGRRRTTR